MIKSGIKKEEYREIKRYYEVRFANDLIKQKDYSYENQYEAISDIERQEYDVIFVNGYKPSSPKIKCHCLLIIDEGNPEWGAEANKLYYVLKILSVEEVE